MQIKQEADNLIDQEIHLQPSNKIVADRFIQQETQDESMSACSGFCHSPGGCDTAA